MARSGLRMMPPFPSPSLKFRKAAFPIPASRPAFQTGPSRPTASSSQRSVCVRPSCSPFHRWILRTVPEKPGALEHRHSSSCRCSTPGALAPVRVILSRSIFTYWPHPPHLQAHPDFAAERLIRDALAVRFRLGDPRVVPCFHCTFLLHMPLSMTAGSSSAVLAQFLHR
jgi:hypothetical protein